MTKFGAFLTIADGIEGMIHVSEILADKRVERPQDVLRVGQIVQAKILEVDAAKRQVKLSMKQLVPTGLDEYLAEHRVGDIVTARILKIQGGTAATIELGDGIYAGCDLKLPEPISEGSKPSGTLDLSALTSMLNARWKGGSEQAKPAASTPEAGQIRKFRLVALDLEKKAIAVELVS